MTIGRHATSAATTPSTSSYLLKLIGLSVGCAAIITLGFAAAIYLTHLYINTTVH
ncbi:hypothetical protein [Amycolatopsis sp. NPDC051102]|uniref:hypothetical protein n=1 Tax=Amycolatopsis sp. NPDC051102 TaxID=3155163 RepID=UPI00342EE6B1